MHYCKTPVEADKIAKQWLAIGEEWNVFSINTIQVPIRELERVQCSMLRNCKSYLKIEGRV
jgi:hypothetical protein